MSKRIVICDQKLNTPAWQFMALAFIMWQGQTEVRRCRASSTASAVFPVPLAPMTATTGSIALICK